nr:methyltransferase domain-containing protein [Ammoniphilus resinae]
MAEAFYYSRIPVHKFLDIGTGPGYFLDAVAKYLPNSKEKFYGIEKFPPKEQYYSQSKNYIIGDLCNLEIKFDAGMCIEVAEHLTPKMLKGLIKDLANISNKGALYIFNTGMPEYVLNEDLNYLDPLIRGHIASYSIKSIKILAEELGFSVFPLKGKTWAFVLEYLSQSSSEENIQDRIWSALNHNMNILSDKDMGTVLKVLGLDTSRAYG